MAGAAAEERRLATVVASWQGRPVLVVGDAMLDEWRFAESERLCREAPAPVLTLRRRISAAGGAANTAVNVAALGGRAALVAPVGADVAGDELHDCLDRASVWDRTVNQPGRPTPVKRRMLAGNQILLREDSGEPEDGLDDDGVARLLTALHCATEELRAAAHGQPLTLVVCDYGLGALPAPVRAWLVANRDRYATVALDAHDLADWRGLNPTVVTPSFAEATRLLARAAAGFNTASRAPAPAGGLHLDHQSDAGDGPSELVVGAAPGGAGTDRDSHGPTGEPTPGEERVALTGDGLSVTGTGVTVNAGVGEGVDRAVLAESRLAELRAHTGADVVAVTLDTEGAVVGGADGEPRRSHSTPVPASHAVGAGDAYLAAMTLALAAAASLPTAAQLAQLAATITVSDTGTCVCRREDLLDALGAGVEGADHPTLVGAEELTAIVAEHRRAGRSIVFTNGCFDVLHPGHVRYLTQARALGDLLVVAVNSDGSVRRLKGPDRPVNPVEDRAALLAALECVDHVVIFEEDSPARLIEAVRPDVYVKGGDYPPEMVPEAPLVRRLGGQVRTLGYVPDRSTSAIIDRIRAQSGNPTVGESRPA
ncbi:MULTISPECIES: D-glycero-beta-D-manno-heptose 1-phosphate adenylyltransferase [Micromonospora]|uniref:D-glycero-beta-D-manno-heptose 1-phosphate adenylyltransferase n=1 Tax=Micromonospora solifontis TaxID=2487138 RepID=A0ABX9WPR9_9ACTN|nr:MULTISPECIES: D-glycero-beta-D-manno-heptose 1-phosphate adenylyltransferase [Micromonospora]NES13217.1 D-glycero-beta-D-manno-heptose 1-phosphate adenylyltransferase [Micromonospora sp. PPF5-17B]NES34586.1 D-glycero-beta-D-manno-heptose 1-phosphate adenylyltransferase [Micromonospora solifontis]NES57050.1 D-glycero-beta-D-manno-heptose 1-phosphate adenylyltransferase [Micromonospora sp. PPF5-6]RNM01839.1 D-glycero-beta-D-manno-heptose 1-phosphate adenylyltransferase [Micromonospora solifont